MKKIRLAEGMTQKQLSELTGLSLGTIKNYESG
ncbi:TPA: helix-turn-helix domain-containing protein, partial [Salmonella enterica subsp. diarizonae]